MAVAHLPDPSPTTIVRIDVGVESMRWEMPSCLVRIKAADKDLAGADGALEATSLNSFGLRGYKGYMFGPVFNNGAAAALEAASAISSS